ncbi:MAG: hypothetical protein RIR16_273 [Actinomycetota bacterium]|jgi:MFS family permease
MSKIQKARLAVFTYFALNGSMLTMWAVRIPNIEQNLSITHAQIGIAILLIGGGALTSMQVTGQLIDRFGSQLTTPITSALMGLGLLGIGLSPNFLWLCVSAFVAGIFIGSTDIGMNAQAVTIEESYGRPIFSAFHGMWSVGGVIGATVGGFFLSINVPIQIALPTWSVVIFAVSLLLKPLLINTRNDHPQSSDEKSESNQANRQVLGLVIFLGLLSGSAAIAEGVGVDWSALHLVKILGAEEATAALAVMFYSGTMAAVRFFVDRLIARIGRVNIIRFGSGISAVGIFIVTLAPTIPVALFGWLVAGMGIAAVVPQFFVLGAEIGEKSHQGRNMAKVVGITYAGVLGGPALIGLLATIVPLNLAIGVGVALGLFTVVGTSIIKRKLEA